MSRVDDLIADREPERIVSLLDPGYAFPDTGAAYRQRHLRLSFHDIHIAVDGLIMPSTNHVRVLLDFLARWTGSGSILVHCRAGISRSTAAAYIAACLHNPGADERTIAATLRRVSPLARPNEVLISLADRAMRRRGRMAQAMTDTGRDLPPIGVSEGEPFEMPSCYHPTNAPKT